MQGKITATALLWFCFNVLSTAQSSDLLIGEWKNYYPYKTGIVITQSKDEVFYGTQFSIVVCDKNANIKKYITQNNGLTDIDLGLIKYTDYNNTLIISYKNGNIDLYRSADDVTSLNYIKANNNIVGKKSINHIFLKNEKTALLSTDFGLLFLNLEREEFSETVFTPFPVYTTCTLNDTTYVSTEGGLYLIPPAVNIQDFGQWQLLNANNGGAYKSTACTVYNNALYFSVNEALVKQNSDKSFTSLNSVKDTRINYLTSEGRHLICGRFCTVGSGCTGQLQLLDENDTITNLSGQSCFFRPLDAVEDSSNRIWIADEWDNFKYYDINSNSCNYFTINSPNTETNFDILVANGKTYVTAGGLILGQNYSFNASGMNVFDHNTKNWSVVNGDVFPELKQAEANFDFLNLASEPGNPGKIFIGSYYGGLIEYDGNKVVLYNEKNSSISGGIGDAQRERVAGLAYDSKGNLWMANTLAPNPIVVKKKDGTWQNFPVYTNNALLHLAIDRNNNKWFVVGGQSGSLYVFNEGADFNSTADDKWREITTSNSNLPSNSINCVSVDNRGDVWVGTAAGPVVFEYGGDIFSSSHKGTRLIVEQDGFGAYLLETENIKTILADGGNRKWFGTDNGVFVQSADGKTLIHKFDTKNSPLPSNSVTSMEINPENGECWIGTSKGIAVYRTEATSGSATHKSNVYAFPNPVRPEYTGQIIITGLAVDSDVKITDTNGKLVYQTISTGGQAVWDGNDFNGRRASTGIYLVFATGTSDSENPAGIVTKIMFVN